MKIVYGICGIGLGHTYRQLPIIELLRRKHKVVICAYGDSYRFYKKKYGKEIKVLKVAVPFIPGNGKGLDLARVKNINWDTNVAAWKELERLIGKPDLVVSDYEPICAKYAYATNAPLVTIDQQSKYFAQEFKDAPVADERERLLLFFPKARLRLACSFFKVHSSSRPRIRIMPPTIRTQIVKIANMRSQMKKGTAKADTTAKTRSKTSKVMQIMVYLSAQQKDRKLLNELLREITHPSIRHRAIFHIFTNQAKREQCRSNYTIYPQGNPRFYEVLSTCSAVIATAGHSLLSEAMHLGIPVLACPLPVFEQQMNAQVIEQGGFGLVTKKITAKSISSFIANLQSYTAAISEDQNYLIRGVGQEKIVQLLEDIGSGH